MIFKNKHNDKCVESVYELEHCSICLESLNLNPDAKKISTVIPSVSKIKPCLHAYHDSCIKSWARSSNICPLCRGKFNIEDIMQLKSIKQLKNKEKKYTTITRNHRVNKKFKVNWAELPEGLLMIIIIIISVNLI